MIGPLPSDMREHAMMERGSHELRKAIEAARAGKDPATRAKLIWRNDPGSDTVASPFDRHERRTAEKDRRAEALRALRDPCPRCGVRMDIGCSHVKHLFSVDQWLTDQDLVNRAWERVIREAREAEADVNLEAKP